MSDYETGRKARREGQPFNANPIWGWFRQCAWERGWIDEDIALRCAQESKGPVRSGYVALAQQA